MGKIGPKFSHLLTVRAEGADPSPPLTVSLTVKRHCFFYDSPYKTSVRNYYLFMLSFGVKAIIFISPLIIEEHRAQYGKLEREKLYMKMCITHCVKPSKCQFNYLSEEHKNILPSTTSF